MTTAHSTARPVIRPYRPADREAVADICVRTAASGGDARGIYSDDLLMPDVYCLPYVTYAPQLAWVVEDRTGDDDAAGPVIGYVIAVGDTRAFVDWQEREWVPGFRERHPAAGPMGRDFRYRESDLLRDGADPGRMLRGISDAELDTYPAHLHIDLLPQGQRRGLGSRLLDTLRAGLADNGVGGVHLGMDPANVGARAFYDRYGFRELPSHRPEVPLLGIRTHDGA